MLFFILTLTSCNLGERKNSIRQNRVESIPTFSQTNVDGKEAKYIKTRDRYANYFKTSEENHYNQALLDKQDNDSLLVLENLLKDILKDVNFDDISKNGKINLETLLPELGFGNLDGLVLNKNNVKRNSSQIVVTTKTLFFDYFKGQINSLDSLSKEQLDNIFTSAFGGGEAHATIFSIVKKTNSKSCQTYGCIGSFGQESGELAPDCILVIASKESYIYIFLEYLNESIKELRACQSISDSLNSLFMKYKQQYDSSIQKDKSLINKAVDFQDAAWKQYCECYQNNLNDKVVFKKIRNQVINVMQYVKEKPAANTQYSQ